MVKVLATNITSPIGWTTEQNYQAYRQGESALMCYDSEQPYTASLFTTIQQSQMAIEGFTRFESLVIHSIKEALSHTIVDVTDNRTIFILSTTKANVEELQAKKSVRNAYLTPGETAQKIADYLGFHTTPIVVSNACISGVSAQIAAIRMLEIGMYDKAVVCGADTISSFTINGFQSFMSLSPQPCRPFDMERTGINLGEAAATIVLTNDTFLPKWNGWILVRGAITNDAYHLSAPQPKGEGMLDAIRIALGDVQPNELATVNAHGTGTMFNDQMESKAIEQSLLSNVPVSAYKGCYGHTLGASGILESILTMRAIEDEIVLPVRGFENKGVSGRININKESCLCKKKLFLKIISGFGGCNASLLYSKSKEGKYTENCYNKQDSELHILHEWKAEANFSPVQEYKQHIGNYPRFYKMDKLCQTAFVATELLLQDAEKKPTSLILFNRSSSILSDKKHLEEIDNNGLASPSVFLYTLPNIMLGEVAIKHGIHGETSLYILEHRDEKLMAQIIESAFRLGESDCILSGWIDCPDEQHIEADFKLYSK